MEFRDDKVVREPIYFGDPWEPPAWRAQWVERFDAGSRTSRFGCTSHQSTGPTESASHRAWKPLPLSMQEGSGAPCRRAGISNSSGLVATNDPQVGPVLLCIQNRRLPLPR
jgi:hypothetical protein